MLTLTRASARAFRALLRKCVPGRSRGLVPAVLIQAQGDALSLVAETWNVTLRYTMPNTGGVASFLIPMTVLEEVEGSADTVEFVPMSKGKALARWSERDVPKEIGVELLPAKQAPTPPALPDDWGKLRRLCSQRFTKRAAVLPANPVATQPSGSRSGG